MIKAHRKLALNVRDRLLQCHDYILLPFLGGKIDNRSRSVFSQSCFLCHAIFRGDKGIPLHGCFGLTNSDNRETCYNLFPKP